MDKNYILICRPHGNIFQTVRYFDNRWTKRNEFNGTDSRFSFTMFDDIKNAHVTTDKVVLLSYAETLKHEYPMHKYGIVAL